MSRPRWRSFLVAALLVLLGLLIVVQFVPYGRAHNNPTVVAEPRWDSPATRELAKRACFDCHSNQTSWPWYSNVAPGSWLVQRHVDEGRRVLNFSDWHRSSSEADEAGEAVRNGEMPPRSYLLLHPEARLTETERARLALALDDLVTGTRENRED